MALYVGNTKYKVMSGGSPASFVVKDALPYDAEIEYLESTGTQWIDTGINPDATTCFIIDGKYTRNQYDCNSGLMTNARFHIGLFQNKFHFGLQGGYVLLDNNDYNRHTFKLQSGLAYIDSTSYSMPAITSTFNGNLFLFARSGNNGAVSFTNGLELYASQISKDGVIVRDYVPVRVGTTGYLYDRVSGQLFGNAGTGDFVLGPDV